MRFIKEKKIINKDIQINFFNNIISTFFFTGYIPKASGTFGSLAAILFFFIPGFYSTFLLSSIIILISIISFFTIPQLMLKYGDDPSVVVVDEAIGMWISLNIVSYFYPSEPSFYIYLIAFLSFRFFDIVKLFPADYFDKLKSSFGVVMDDVVAGVYSGIITLVINMILKKFILLH